MTVIKNIVSIKKTLPSITPIILNQLLNNILLQDYQVKPIILFNKN